jgi:hypothetical protein
MKAWHQWQNGEEIMKSKNINQRNGESKAA